MYADIYHTSRPTGSPHSTGVKGQAWTWPRITTCLFLEDLGYAVLVAENPEQVLTLAAAHSGEIHLLLTDVVMPGRSGRDLARRLLELCPSITRLFISGFTRDVIAHRGILDDGVFLPPIFMGQHRRSA